MSTEGNVVQDQADRPVHQRLRAVSLVKRGLCDCEDKTFEEWAEDLENRLNQHLVEHPEEEQEIEARQVTAKVKRGIVTVEPDPRRVDCWCVYESGLKRMAFFGSDAQSRASKWAADFINGKI